LSIVKIYKKIYANLDMPGRYSLEFDIKEKRVVLTAEDGAAAKVWNPGPSPRDVVTRTIDSDGNHIDQIYVPKKDSVHLADVLLLNVEGNPGQDNLQESLQGARRFVEGADRDPRIFLHVQDSLHASSMIAQVSQTLGLRAIKSWTYVGGEGHAGQVVVFRRERQGRSANTSAPESGQSALPRAARRV
jgi:hypothetical protein